MAMNAQPETQDNNSLLANLWERAKDFPESRLILAILIGGALLAWQAEVFLSGRNLRSVMLAISFSAIAAMGQLLVILTGRIDLSTGSTMALSGMITALSLVAGVPVPIAIAIGICVGGIVGFVNGFISMRFGISSFIVTLGTLQVARGITVGPDRGRHGVGICRHIPVYRVGPGGGVCHCRCGSCWCCWSASPFS